MSVSRTFEFSIHYQRSLLHRILSDSKFAVQAVPLLKQDVFDSYSLKWICNKIMEGGCTVRILMSELKKDKVRLDQRTKEPALEDELVEAIKSDLKSFLRPFNESESNYAVDQLHEFVETQDLVEAMRQAATMADEGAKSKEVRSILHSAAFSRYSSVSESVDPIVSQEVRFKKRQDLVDNGELIFVSSGFKVIDDDIKGPRPGQIWVYFGDTNIGKSQASISVGFRNIMKGFRVLHFPIEDPIDMTLQRYDASFTKISYDELTMSRLSEKQQERIHNVFKILKDKRSDYLRVSKLEENTTMAEVQAEYHRLKARYNFRPDVVIIDSLFDMDPVQKQESYRLGAKQVYKEARNFARHELVSVIAFDQTKQKEKDKVADTSAASESYDKARIVDGFITLNQNKTQKKDRTVEFYIAKMRDRKKRMAYLHRTNFQISRFIPIK